MTRHHDADLAIRRPVWLALSEFYLDTELTEMDFEQIAGIFNQSGLDRETIKEIDLYEVFPLLQWNLLSAAGVWNGFDEEWLFSNCERLYHKRNNWFHRLQIKFWNKRFYWMRKDYWQRVDAKLNAINPDRN